MANYLIILAVVGIVYAVNVVALPAGYVAEQQLTEEQKEFTPIREKRGYDHKHSTHDVDYSPHDELEYDQHKNGEHHNRPNHHDHYDHDSEHHQEHYGQEHSHHHNNHQDSDEDDEHYGHEEHDEVDVHHDEFNHEKSSALKQKQQTGFEKVKEVKYEVEKTKFNQQSETDFAEDEQSSGFNFDAQASSTRGGGRNINRGTERID